MKKNIHLTATVDKPEVLENIIEELAKRQYTTGNRNIAVPKCLQPIDTSSIESYVSGNVEFDYNETQRIRVPYITGFIFSCIKEKYGIYELKWGLSLS